jgi:preprotein translocase SecF subunit
VRFGACAVAAMFHDLLVILGFTAVMGMILGWEIDALFLTAVLTVVGFSLQDTIVVFDRIRENLNNRKNRSLDFETIANMSVGQVFKRSFITQLNAMFVMVAILLFGGAAVKPFIAVLFVGLLSGTYSSIFTAVPLLVSWEKRTETTPSARTA